MSRDDTAVLNFYRSLYYEYHRAVPLLFGEIRYGYFAAIDEDFQDAVIDDVIEATR